MLRSEFVHAQRSEAFHRRPSGSSPIGSVAGIAIDVVASAPIRRVDIGEVSPRGVSRCSVHRIADVVINAPLASRNASVAGVEQVFVKHDHVPGFCGQDL